MEITFKTKKLETLCENRKKGVSKFNPQVYVKIVQRLNEIGACENMKQLYSLPNLKLHMLKGNYKDHFAINVNNKVRIIFLPQGGVGEYYENGIFQSVMVEKVVICSIEDYHD